MGPEDQIDKWVSDKLSHQYRRLFYNRIKSADVNL